MVAVRRKGLLGYSAFALLTAVALFQVQGWAAAPAKSVAVTTVIADTLNGYPLRIASDLKGPYVSTTQVSSTIDGLGDWSLTTYSGNRFTPSNRTVFFDLTEPASPSNPAPPVTAAYVQSHLIAKCHLVNVAFAKIPVGGTVQCPGSFRFQAPGGLWYRFSFQPDNFPEVNRMNVTCTAADASGCKAWTISTGGAVVTGTDQNPKSLNKLVQIDPVSDKVLADLGDYYLSFRITLTR